MDLSGIISISGKPGLYKVVASNKTSLVVESLVDGKKTTALPTHRISALEDIAIYTEDDDIPLKDVYSTIFDKENGGAAPNHKTDMSELKAYMLEILPDYDQDRVYNSDLKKLFQWFNLLVTNGILFDNKEEEEKPKKETTKKTVAKKTATKTAARRASASKATAAKASPKNAAKARVKKSTNGVAVVA